MNRSCRGVVPLVLIAALWPAASAFSTLAAERQEGRAQRRRPRGRRRRRWRGRRHRRSRPTADGFIQRWLILEPIRVPGQLTQSAVRTAVEKDFPVPSTPLPHDGEKLKVGDSELTWHAVDTINYNVNLYHFAYALNKPTIERALLGRHRRQLAARDARRAPGHRLERRVGVVGQRQGSDRALQRSPGGD